MEAKFRNLKIYIKKFIKLQRHINKPIILVGPLNIPAQILIDF